MDSYEEECSCTQNENLYSEDESQRPFVNVTKKSNVGIDCIHITRSVAQKLNISEKCCDTITISEKYSAHEYTDDKSSSCDLSTRSSDVYCVCEGSSESMIHLSK
ncbi:hypothetical protein KPH14_001957 [Odynerus spinipes]|uniref:Uncharacterized protein n=1 Tax=Odynerus spinipes TaxID=1348599 RepID=A0AAD9S053_9HYME|nr:hypothetical protein KPH14_001957 [Odynerus spinipes]